MFDKSTALLVIDMQKGFVKYKRHIKLAQRVCSAASNYQHVLLTRYINSVDSPCSKWMSYNGCMPNTEDAGLCTDILPLYEQGYPVFDKSTYSSATTEVLAYLSKHNIAKVHLAGIDTGCCVMATAYALFDLGYNVSVCENLCDTTESPSIHIAAISILRHNIPTIT